MAFWPAPFSEEQTRSWITGSLESYKVNGWGRCAVELKANGLLIGDAGIMLSELDGRPEYDLGYIIHSEYWRNGFAYEAASRCLDYAVNEQGLSRVCINMPEDHSASRRVAEKLGMNMEGTFRNKRNRDKLTYLYSNQVRKPEA